jgi:hypothetical protein
MEHVTRIGKKDDEGRRGGFGYIVQKPEVYGILVMARIPLQL